MAFLALSTAFLGFIAGQSGHRPTQQQPQQQVHTVTRHESASQRRSDGVDRMGHPWLSWRCRPRSWGSLRASQDTDLHSSRNNKCTQSLDTSPHRSMGWAGSAKSIWGPRVQECPGSSQSRRELVVRGSFSQRRHRIVSCTTLTSNHYSQLDVCCMWASCARA